MRVAILGIDGYIGWPLALHLLGKGYEVSGLDNCSRRQRVDEVGSASITPILPYIDRLNIIKKYPTYINEPALFNLHGSYSLIKAYLHEIQPDAIVHLAEMPSAPWSMIDAEHAAATQYENILGTLNLLWAMREECPSAHLIKLGTMGEYGTPDCIIPEGIIPPKCIKKWWDQAGFECPMAGLLFPRTAGSYYHLTKVHDTTNIHFACRIWGLRSTDIMQGVLYGLNTYDENSVDILTRFDFDEHFGTAINRFCAQALVDMPLTVFGKGEQSRGFLPLRDSIQCLNIAIDNPPEEGEYRTFNQFEEVYSVNQLARYVAQAAIDQGMSATIDHIPNPRVEAEEHYYNPVHQKLFDLGYVPTMDIRSEIYQMLKLLKPYKHRICKDPIMPKTLWR